MALGVKAACDRRLHGKNNMRREQSRAPVGMVVERLVAGIGSNGVGRSRRGMAWHGKRRPLAHAQVLHDQRDAQWQERPRAASQLPTGRVTPSLDAHVLLAADVHHAPPP